MKIYLPFRQPRLVLMSLLLAGALAGQSQSPRDGSTAMLDPRRNTTWHASAASESSDNPESADNSDTRYLAEFSARKKGKNIQLTWKALGQLQPRAFEVERSVGGSSYIQIGRLPNADRSSFSFVDKVICQPAYYYRIKIITRAGKTFYSKSLRVDLKKGKAALTPLAKTNRSALSALPAAVASKKTVSTQAKLISINLQNGAIRQIEKQAIEFSDCLLLSFNSRQAVTVEVELNGQQGRIRLLRKFQAGPGKPACRIDQLGLLPAGSYRLCIVAGGRRQWFNAEKKD